MNAPSEDGPRPLWLVQSEDLACALRYLGVPTSYYNIAVKPSGRLSLPSGCDRVAFLVSTTLDVGEVQTAAKRAARSFAAPIDVFWSNAKHEGDLLVSVLSIEQRRREKEGGHE